MEMQIFAEFLHNDLFYGILIVSPHLLYSLFFLTLPYIEQLLVLF